MSATESVRSSPTPAAAGSANGESIAINLLVNGERVREDLQSTDTFTVVIRTEPPSQRPAQPVPEPTRTCAPSTTAGWTLMGLGGTAFLGGVFTVASAFTFNTVTVYIAPMVTGGVAAVALGGVLAMAGFNRLVALRTVGF